MLSSERECWERFCKTPQVRTACGKQTSRKTMRRQTAIQELGEIHAKTHSVSFIAFTGFFFFGGAAAAAAFLSEKLFMAVSSSSKISKILRRFISLNTSRILGFT